MAGRVGVLLLVLSVSSAAAGCGDGEAPSPNAPATANEDEIRGGEASPSSEGVGLLWLLDGGTCSGVLIAPDVVATAGHCITSQVGAFLTGQGGPLASGADPRSNGMRLYRVNDYVRFDNGGGSVGPDVAVVHLETRVPAADMAPVARARAPVARGTRCFTVGYGRDGADVKGSRRRASVDVTDVTTSAYATVGVDGQVDSGDSGGGLFCNGALAGTTWARSATAAWPVNKQAFFARVDVVQGWIDGHIAGWNRVTRWPPANALPAAR